MGAVEGVTEPDDHAAAAVQHTTDPDVRISDRVVRSIGAVQRMMDPEARMTHADGLRADAEGGTTDL